MVQFLFNWWIFFYLKLNLIFWLLHALCISPIILSFVAQFFWVCNFSSKPPRLRPGIAKRGFPIAALPPVRHKKSEILWTQLCDGAPRRAQNFCSETSEFRQLCRMLGLFQSNDVLEGPCHLNLTTAIESFYKNHSHVTRLFHIDVCFCLSRSTTASSHELCLTTSTRRPQRSSESVGHSVNSLFEMIRPSALEVCLCR